MDVSLSTFNSPSGETAIPSSFLFQLLRKTETVLELKVALVLSYLLYQKRNYPRFVAFSEIVSFNPVLEMLKPYGLLSEGLKQVLGRLVELDLFLPLPLKIGDEVEPVYFFNISADRRAMKEIAEGRLEVVGPGAVTETQGKLLKPTDIFNLYEENVGIITPMVAEELKDAQGRYPPRWIEEAFREATLLNKRNWKYIARILERWSTEGKDGESWRDTKEKTDPDKFIRGKYGRFVKR